jgi:ATP-dependent Clp protease ATP-binding subunit ClpB
VIFHPLKQEDIARIIDIQMRYLQKVLEQKHLTLTLTDRAKEFLARVGYDPVYGARPLKRAIQQYIQNPLAVELLNGSVREGEQITADYDSAQDKLTFQTVAVSSAGPVL